MKYTIITGVATTMFGVGTATPLSVAGAVAASTLEGMLIRDGGNFSVLFCFATTTATAGAANLRIHFANYGEGLNIDENPATYLAALTGLTVTQVDVTADSAQGLELHSLASRIASFAIGKKDLLTSWDKTVEVGADIVALLTDATNGLTAIKTAVGSVSTALTTVDGRLTNATTGLANIKSLIDTLDTVADSIKTSIDHATYGLSALKTEMSADKTINTETNGYIENATYGLANLKTLIDAISTLLGHATYGLSATHTDVEAVKTSLADGTNGLAAIRTALTTLDSELSGTDISAIKSIVQGIRTKIDGTTF